MNFRNRKLVITIRTVLGLMFLLSGVMGLISAFNHSLEGVPPALIPVMQAFSASGILYMIKATEAVAGLMMVTGFLPALAAIFVAPICIGVIVFNAMLAPSFVVAGILLSVLNAYLGYAYWDKYKALFERR